MLEIKGVKKSYGEFQLDCSLNVEKGRITGLVGENGAGKSTLFKAVLGLISYDAGEIKILGKTQEDRHASYRILRGVKNRFGSTNEIGVFEMREEGLVEVENPSEFMLAGRPEGASGSVVACSMEGTRPILIEIQALVCASNFGMPRRTAAGTDYNRVNLLMAVLEKRLGLHLSASDAYVNIAGGIRMNEPAVDLGILLAVVSSYKDIVIDDKVLVFGEVGLSGEVRAVSMAEQRVQEAKKLGFTTVILPAACMKSVGQETEITLIPVENIRDAVRFLEQKR